MQTFAKTSDGLFFETPLVSSQESASVIVVDVATASSVGVVQPDNVTTTVNGAGVISAVGGGGFPNPMTTLGDIITGGAAGTPERLGIGSTGQVLTVTGGVPAWGSSLTNPMTTAGDIIIGGTAGAANRLAIGSTGQVLTVTAGLPAWSTPFTNPMTTAGDIIIGGVSGAATRLAIGSTGQVLTVSAGAPAWSTPFTNPMTTAGDIIIGGVSGAATRLAIGSTGQVLTVTAGAPAWATPFTNPMTTAGDIIIGGVSGAATRLPIGSTGQVLTVAAGAPAWQAAGGGGGGMTQIAQTVASGAGSVISFTGIPGTFSQLMIFVQGRSTTAAFDDALVVTFNGDTGNNYTIQQMFAVSTSVQGGNATAQPGIEAAGVAGATAVATLNGITVIEIPSYANASFIKMLFSRYAIPNGSAINNVQLGFSMGVWNNAAAINRIDFTLLSGANFVNGSTITIYGLQ